MKEPNYSIGHKVYIDGVTSMAAYSHESVIDDIDIKWNEDTGEPFHIYKIDDRWWTDSGHGAGGPYKSNFMYDVIYDAEKYSNFLDSNNLFDDI